MKVNLSIDNPNSLNGYLNLDPILKEAGGSKIRADIMNIDEYVDNSEAEEIRATNVLTYYDSNKVDDILNNWIKKLRKNGIIELSEVDIEKAFKAFARGEINISKLNTLIFGEQIQKWDLKKSGFNLNTICEALKAKGLEIIEKTYHGYKFVIKAKRIK